MKTITHLTIQRLLAMKNYAFLFGLILTICTSVFAEVLPVKQWEAFYEGVSYTDDIAYALAVDSSGNVYVTGESDGRYATIKYDPNGNQLWEARDNEYGTSVALAVDSSGNVYVTGYIDGGSDTNDDYATIKYDPNGNQLWEANYNNGPADGDDHATGLAVDNFGNVYVTGYITTTGYYKGYNYATIKYDTNGHQLWVAPYGPSYNARASAIAVDNSGNVYVTGFSQNNLYPYTIDYATVKYNTNGNQLWVAIYNGNYNDEAYALKVDSTGVYVTGRSGGFGTGDDYATIKYDTGGNQLWVARYNGPESGFDIARALALDGLGNVYVTGDSYGSIGLSDYATVKYGPDGNQLWVARYNYYEDIPHALAVDNSGNVYVTGESGGCYNPGACPYRYCTIKYNANGQQLWVVKDGGNGDYHDSANALAVDNSGNVYVTGRAGEYGYYNYDTIKYSQYGSRIYVDTSATGANNGVTWADAFNYLHDALDFAYANSQVSEIWVAQGTYRPDEDTAHPGGTNDRTATFGLKNSLAIYGGFPSGGGTWESCNPYVYQSILSGDIGVAGNSDNSYHVVTGSGTNSTAVLYGFTITAGNANGSSPYDNGGGMFIGNGSPLVQLCTFSGNSAINNGGGMYNYSSSSPTVRNCTFTGNSASIGGGMSNGNSSSPALNYCTFTGNSATYGGGMYNYHNNPVLSICTFTGNSATIGGGMCNYDVSSPTVRYCKFIGNTATNGGGIYNYNQSSPFVTNCIFSGNSTSNSGGGMFNSYSSSPILTNCTLSGNSASSYGGGMDNSDSNPNLRNCILWGNTAPIGPQIYNSGTSSPAVSFSDVQGGYSGTGNINANPLFGDADGPDNIIGTADDNLRLLFGSPCIDAADNNSVPYGITVDLDLLPRFKNDPCTVDTGNGTPPIVDMGAYEYQPPPPGQASNPSPAYGATEVNLNAILSWTAGAGAISHDVYFSTTNPPPFQVNQSGTTYNPGWLTASTTYFWRIDEKNDGGTTTGILWIFTTTNSGFIYVDANATGANNGSSWANAYKYLQDALTSASSGTEIWVAQGTYRPDEDTAHPSGTDDRTATFQLKNGAAIYGGFPNGGGNWASRDPNLYKTILSGDIGIADNNSDNSYHVVTGSGTNSTSILDGFTITAGNTTGSYSYGGGMYNGNYSSPTVSNCTFSGNSGDSGGGMYNEYSSPTVNNCTFIGNSTNGYYGYGGGMSNSNSSPTVTNCIFTSNSANYSGGGIYNGNGYPILTNCTFAGNSAGEGGGIYNYSYEILRLTNCTFSGNSAATNGGGMCNANGNSTLTNCTFSGNSAGEGGGIYYAYAYGYATITNCIFWNNNAPTGAQIQISGGNISYCNIQGGWEGTGNIDSDPLFVDANGPDDIIGTQDDNLRLSPGSPCIDAADNTAVPVGVVTDLDDLPRFADDPLTGNTGNGTPPIVDMGAYEYQPPPLYVDAGAKGANDGSSWADAYKHLQDALNVSSTADIWVAQGTYRPDENTSNPGGTDDRTATFQLKKNVAIYGGFPGGGGEWESRDPNIYETILSGDIGVADNNSDNSYHVVTGSDINSTSILDGFTITAGNTDGLSTNVTGAGIYDSNGSPTVTNCKFIGNSANGYPNSYGGGMYNGNYSSPTVTNCTFIGNSAYSYGGYSYGGGMYNDNYSSPTVTNCTFIGNSAYYYGGGMYNSNGSPTVTNCTFNGNSAYVGGGMCNYNSSNPMVTNCTFTGNEASYGGGMYNENYSSPTLTNCAFSGNEASYGGGMYNYNLYYGNPIVTNCIFWSNTAPSGPQIYNAEGSVTVSFSDVQGGWAGTGNINANPLFIDANGPDGIIGTEDDNLRLSDGSPCIDKGNNAGVPADIADLDGDGNTTEPTPLDLDLRPRFVDGDFNGTIVVDMGAYEYDLDCPYTSDFDGDCAVDFFDFAILANSWLQNDPLRDIAPPPAGDGIVNMEDLAVLCDNWLAGK